MKHVLVVDDVQDNITLLTFDLEDDKFDVIPALDGQSCIERARIKPTPDIILLDIHMPGIDGIKTLETLKEDEDTKDIPVIMVSASDTESSIVQAIDLGAHDFVTKPIDYPVLAARMRSALRLSEALKALEHANIELNTLATTDSLTGIYNRRHFFTLSKNEASKKSRHNRHLSVMMIDIDFFKKINDTYGHAAGDVALKSLIDTIHGARRNYDIVGRLGGEEFAICSPDANLEGAKVLAERIRSMCEDMSVHFQEHNFSITVSIGITELRDNEDFDTALQRSDELLYKAKENGRNQIISGL